MHRAACLLLNFGHYTRNLSLFGSPIGPQAGDSVAKITSDVISPSSVLSNITRNIGLHLGTPSWRVNNDINDAIGELHRYLNIDINDPRTTFLWTKFQVLYPSLHEDTAENLLHLSHFRRYFCFSYRRKLGVRMLWRVISPALFSSFCLRPCEMGHITALSTLALRACVARCSCAFQKQK
jgi:hypothetical protein